MCLAVRLLLPLEKEHLKKWLAETTPEYDLFTYMYVTVDYDGETRLHTEPPFTNVYNVHVFGVSVGYPWGSGTKFASNTEAPSPGAYAL